MCVIAARRETVNFLMRACVVRQESFQMQRGNFSEAWQIKIGTLGMSRGEDWLWWQYLVI